MEHIKNARPQRITSASKLAQLMAGKARLLRDIIEQALIQDGDSQTDLRGYMQAFQQVLIHDITPKTFADIYAQTIAYGMFAARLHDEGARRGLRVLDCPVTGGRAGAENAKLALFVGGEHADFDACTPLFAAVSARASYMGKAGSGQAAKAANQIAVAGVLSGVCESLAYARAAGLDLNELFPLLCAGSAKSSQLEKIGAKILAGDDTPSFFVRYLAKDLRIGVGEADSLGLTLEVARDTLANLDELSARGMGELGTQALVHHYEKEA